VKRGEYFPPFLYLSIINSCNLRCQGCWVDVEADRNAIDLDTLNQAITDAKQHGNAFFGILGGEPFMHPQMLDVLAAHPDCYFQVFTNGQFITEKEAKRLAEIGNATPLISIEGREITSDVRRGNTRVLNRTMRGLDNCLKAGLLTGVATSVCQSNIDELLTEEWLQELIACGVHYAWYHGYRPMSPKPNFDLALRPGQLVRIRKFVVEMRAKMPIAIIDAYYGHDGKALCPMVTGVSHHVSPTARHRTLPHHSIRHGKHTRFARRVRDDAFVAISERLSRTIRPGHARLRGAGAARSGEGACRNHLVAGFAKWRWRLPDVLPRMGTSAV